MDSTINKILVGVATAAVLGGLGQALLSWRAMALMEQRIQTLEAQETAEAKFWDILAQTRSAINADRVQRHGEHPEIPLILFEWNRTGEAWE